MLPHTAPDDPIPTHHTAQRHTMLNFTAAHPAPRPSTSHTTRPRTPTARLTSPYDNPHHPTPPHCTLHPTQTPPHPTPCHATHHTRHHTKPHTNLAPGPMLPPSLGAAQGHHFIFDPIENKMGSPNIPPPLDRKQNGDPKHASIFCSIGSTTKW